MTRTALELIAQSGLGYSIDTLADDSYVHPFSTAVKQMMYVLTLEYLYTSRYYINYPWYILFRTTMFSLVFVRTYFLSTLVKLGPPNFRKFIVDILPFENVRRLRNIVDIIHNTSVEILEAKKRALKEGGEAVANQVGGGKDIMSILCMYFRTFCHSHIY
jgi:hypothetical protein